MARAAATAYRNYLVPVDGWQGQTTSAQLNGLSGLAPLLALPASWW